MDRAQTSSDSTNKLHEAIRKLEAYSLQQMEPEAPSVLKTMSLMRSVLAKRFDFQPKEHRHQPLAPDKNEVLTAIELINRNRFFIEKLKEGTPAEKELAEKIVQTINNYNASCDKRIQLCVSGKERLIHFLSNDKQKNQHLPKITLPKKVIVQCHYENSASAFLHKITSKIGLDKSLSKQSAELFQMKTISLLENFHGTASSTEERMCIKNTPIHVDIDENTSVCTLTQILSLFPGQTIIVKGNAPLHPITRMICQLGSFSLELEQANFPHPIQRTGWTVASQLLPDSPQRLDLLNEVAELFHRRSQMVADLSLKNGKLLGHAKKLLSLKKKAFQAYSKELIDLHKTLAKAILKAAHAVPAADGIAEQFFGTLYEHTLPFAALSEASQAMREYFMTMPHQRLLNAIIKGKSTDLASAIPETRYAAAKTILDQSIVDAKMEICQMKAEAKSADEMIKWGYVACMGEVLGKASNQIYLQYLSEDLMYEPPVLSPFEYQVQAAAYGHLKDFLGELTLGSEISTEAIYQLVKSQIISDIAIFGNKVPTAISKELAAYFHGRYLSLNML